MIAKIIAARKNKYQPKPINMNVDTVDNKYIVNVKLRGIPIGVLSGTLNIPDSEKPVHEAEFEVYDIFDVSI